MEKDFGSNVAVCDADVCSHVQDEVKLFLQSLFVDKRFKPDDCINVIDPRENLRAVADALGVSLSEDTINFIQRSDWVDLLQYAGVEECAEADVPLPRYVRLLTSSTREASSACEFMMFVLYDGRFVEQGHTTPEEIASCLKISVSDDILEEVAQSDWIELRAEAISIMTEERIRFLASIEDGALASRMDGTIGLAVGIVTVAGVITIIISIASGSSTHPSRREGVTVLDGSEFADEKL